MLVRILGQLNSRATNRDWHTLQHGCLLEDVLLKLWLRGQRDAVAWLWSSCVNNFEVWLLDQRGSVRLGKVLGLTLGLSLD